ncbi:MAG: endonuclease/exonuclease/phosphatase family protein [Gemmatimonadota bacterium]|nr:MAG: endonuclease/exonuclease/phosphatase family protein [Gemmatimonadota bacterium]
MATLRIMTFNVENMLVRFRFREWEKKSLATLLDVDSDVDRAMLIRTHWNVLNNENRVLTALTMREGDPDVMCMQEVENMRALRAFDERYLRRISRRDYRHKILMEGNDPRGIDVAVMSRFRIVNAVTHQYREGQIDYLDGPRTERIFRRDCLEVAVKKENKILPIFVCHFKSMSGGRRETAPIRRAEALEVRNIIMERFDDPATSDWVIVGDLNDYTETDGQPDTAHALGPLFEDGFSVDLVRRIDDPLDRWTHYYPADDTYHQLDYVLVSPALAERNQGAVPTIIRKGQPYRAERYQGDRLQRLGYDQPKASDHCPVLVHISY